MASIEKILLNATQQLINAGLNDTPKLDAELLLANTLDKDRTYLFTWGDKDLDPPSTELFNAKLSQRLAGKPIAHIIGFREFWGLNLKVTKDTLIPRPDTETLIETVLALPLADNAHVLDMGTGTGAIALAIKSELPNTNVSALDFSPAALEVAKFNANNLGLKINFYQSSWFENISSNQLRFDCIATNPPYIEDADPHLNQGDVRFEPITALTSGQDGLDDIRLIIEQAKQHLNDNGWLVIEHGYNQAKAIEALFKQHAYCDYKLVHDLGGNPRVSLARFKA